MRFIVKYYISDNTKSIFKKIKSYKDNTGVKAYALQPDPGQFLALHMGV